MRLPVPLVESRKIRSSSARLPKQELRALCSNRLAASLVKEGIARRPKGKVNQRLSKSLLLYTIALIF